MGGKGLEPAATKELSRQSGLSLGEIDMLDEYHLLVPDTKCAKYRPKLVGWSKKLKEKLLMVGPVSK